MRISTEQIAIIRQATHEVCGVDAQAWLFGSRLDDRQHGGDIDLMIDIPQPVQETAWLAASLAARLQRRLQGRKVDILLAAPNLKRLPIHEVAFQQGKHL